MKKYLFKKTLLASVVLIPGLAQSSSDFPTSLSDKIHIPHHHRRIISSDSSDSDESITEINKSNDREEISAYEAQKLAAKFLKRKQKRLNQPGSFIHSLRDAIAGNETDLLQYLEHNADDDELDCAVPSEPEAPRTHRHTIGRFFKTRLRDDYHWLQDQGILSGDTDQHTHYTSDILELIKAENRFSSYQVRSKQEDHITRRLKEFSGQALAPFPEEKDGYSYYKQRACADEHFKYFRRNIETGEVQLVLNVEKLLKSTSYAGIFDLEISPDHRVLALQMEKTGGEAYDIIFFEIETQGLYTDVITDTAAGLVFGTVSEGLPGITARPQRKGLFYVKRDEAMDPKFLMYHTFGVNEDRVIYHEKSPEFSLSIGSSTDERFLLLKSGNYSNESIFIQSVDNPTPDTLIQIQGDETLGECNLDILDNDFYLMTSPNHTDGTLWRIPVNTPEFSKRECLIENTPGKYITTFKPYKNHMAVLFLENMHPFIEVYSRTDMKLQKVIRFSDASHTLDIPGTNPNDPFLRIHYASTTVPQAVLEYNFETGVLIKRSHEKAPRYHPEKYETRIEYIQPTSPLLDIDYAEKLPFYRELEHPLAYLETEFKGIPVSLWYKKNLSSDAENRLRPLKDRPLYVTAYSAYGMQEPLVYYRQFADFVDQGVVVANVHARGDKTYGAAWHLFGKGIYKKNTFTDTADAIHALHAKQISQPNSTIFEGVSAGGLIAGHIFNQHPDLVKAVFFTNAFFEPLGELLSEDRYLAKGEWSEFGNPKMSRDDFENLHDISPYRQLKPQKHPIAVITNGLNDVRTPYWGALKFAARLRALRTDDTPAYCYFDIEGGHIFNSEEAEMSSEVFRSAMMYQIWGLNLEE